MGTFEGNLQSVYVEWADVSMLLPWLQAQEAQSNHQKGDQSGLICSDNNKDSSDNLGTKAQSSSIRLGTQTAWFHFMFFSAAVRGCEELLETVVWISMKLLSFCDTTWEYRNDSSYPAEGLSEGVVD